MDSIEESNSFKSLNKGLPKLGITLFIIIALFQIYRHYELSKARYNSERIVTLNVTASGTPNYTQGSKHQTSRYSLKAKELNCQFWIINGGLDLILNNDTKRHRIESIQRGDILKLDIYESDEKHLNGLYSEVELIGLSINNDIIYKADDVRINDKEKRKWGLITACIFELFILVALIWNWTRKNEE